MKLFILYSLPPKLHKNNKKNTKYKQQKKNCINLIQFKFIFQKINIKKIIFNVSVFSLMTVVSLTMEVYSWILTRGTGEYKTEINKNLKKLLKYCTIWIQRNKEFVKLYRMDIK